jgi:DNA-directed RNA polymerase subunit RPC12/RpoP
MMVEVPLFPDWPTRETARLVTVAGGTQRHVGFFLHCHECGRELHREDTSTDLGRFLRRHGWKSVGQSPLAVECPYCEFGVQLRLPVAT